MTNTFYIAETKSNSGSWYMLIVRDTHFCITCGSDLDKVVKSLKRCVKRTRTRERLFKELRGLDCKGRVSPATFDQREQYFREHGEDYADLVHSTVVEAIREAKEEDKKNSPLRKTTNRLKKVGLSPLAKTVVDSSPKVDSPAPQDSPRLLRKPRVFNHK